MLDIKSSIPAFEGHGSLGSPEAKPHADILRENAASRQRRKLRKKALKYFDERLPWRFAGKAEARRKVEQEGLREAKRLVDFYERQAVAVHGVIDFSEVQELRTKLVRRDHILDAPQAAYLNGMDRMIAEDKMTKAEFERMASTVLRMEPAIPEATRREWAKW